MFNLGLPEILVIAAASLLVFGPKRLPELAKAMGKSVRDFKRALEGGDDEKDNAPLNPPTADERAVPKGPTVPQT